MKNKLKFMQERVLRPGTVVEIRQEVIDMIPLIHWDASNDDINAFSYPILEINPTHIYGSDCIPTDLSNMIQVENDDDLIIQHLMVMVALLILTSTLSITPGKYRCDAYHGRRWTKLEE